MSFIRKIPGIKQLLAWHQRDIAANLAKRGMQHERERDIHYTTQTHT